MSHSSFSCGQPCFHWKQFQSHGNYDLYKDDMILYPKHENLKEQNLLNAYNEDYIEQFNNLVTLKSKHRKLTVHVSEQ